jgi:hypothetical protein
MNIKKRKIISIFCTIGVSLLVTVCIATAVIWYVFAYDSYDVRFPTETEPYYSAIEIIARHSKTVNFADVIDEPDLKYLYLPSDPHLDEEDLVKLIGVSGKVYPLSPGDFFSWMIFYNDTEVVAAIMYEIGSWRFSKTDMDQIITRQDAVFRVNKTQLRKYGWDYSFALVNNHPD